MRRIQWIPYSLSSLCGLLIIARLVWPKLNFDGTSLTLFAVGVTAALLPSVLPFLPPIKKLKLFQIEAEFERHIDALAKSVNAAETEASSAAAQVLAPRPVSQKLEMATEFAQLEPADGTIEVPVLPNEATGQTKVKETQSAKEADSHHIYITEKTRSATQQGSGSEPWQVYFDEYFQIVSSSSSSREKILSVAILLERMLQNVAAAFEILPNLGRSVRSPREIVNLLMKNGLLTQSEASAFNEFWAIRNKAVHGEMIFVSDADAARILDLAWRLVRIFA